MARRDITITHDFDGVEVEFGVSFVPTAAEPDVGISGDGFEDLSVDEIRVMGASFARLPDKKDKYELEQWIEKVYENAIMEEVANYYRY